MTRQCDDCGIPSWVDCICFGESGDRYAQQERERENAPMKVLVCGSRGWTDREAIARRLCDFHDPDLEVIHGAASGADRIAGDEADALMLTVRAFPADWDRHGRRAGIVRNLAMLDECPDLVLAFRCRGVSRGTDHTIMEARRRGIPVEVITGE